MVEPSFARVRGLFACALAIGGSFIVASSASSIGCTPPVPTDDQPCPCETGWYCCSWVVPTPICAPTMDACPMDPAYEAVGECSNGIDLGVVSVSSTTSVVTESHDPAMTVRVLGLPLTSLMAGYPVTFDYAASASLTVDGLLRTQGWLFSADVGDTFSLTVAAKDGSSLSVPLQVYGPIDIELWDAGGGCSENAAPSAVADSQWTAPQKGIYFVTPTPPLTMAGTAPTLQTPSVATQNSVLSFAKN